MTSTIPAELLELKPRFEIWRTNRKYVREPIPDELWIAAADLTRRYPPSLVGRVLKIDPSSAPRSPFQNPYAERVIGSIRRECLDHLIIIGEDHSLERNSPFPRELEAPAKGKVVAIPQVEGLHHRYRRAAYCVRWG